MCIPLCKKKPPPIVDMNGNDTFLDINNAHLRVNNGNVQASTFVLDQIDFIASSNASTTVGFNNPTTAFLAASNIEVGTANLFVDTSTSNVGIGTDAPLHTLDVRGDMGVSSNLEVGTANLFVDTSTSNVGIGTNIPMDALHINGGTLIGGHVLPTQHQQFDIGSAERKIRHLFLSDNSLWLGDETRITFSGGKMKFRRRKKNILPRGLRNIGIAAGHANETATRTAALAHAGKTDITEMKLEHWVKYAKTLDATKDISDVFTEDADDYEATTASEAFKEIGDDIFSTHNVAIGKITAPTSALDVVGTVKATAFEGDGSALTGITSGQWTESGGNIYRSSGNVGVGMTDPKSAFHVSGDSARLAIADNTENDCDVNGFNTALAFVDNTWNGSTLYADNPAAGMGFYLGHVSSSNKEINMRNLTGELSFGTRDSGARAMTIDNNGKVTIGNTSTKTSDTYLDISSDGGNAYAQGIRLIHHGTDDSNMYGWRIRGDDTDDCFHINRINAGSQLTSALTIKSNGIMTTPSRPAFYAWDNVSSRSGTTLTFNSTTYNVGSHYNTSTSRFKTPVAGTYIFAATISHDTVNTLGEVIYTFYVDGSNRRDIMEGTDTHDAHYEKHGVYIVNLNANQYVDIRARSSHNITFVNGDHGAYYRNCFQGALLG